jgi:seryl-tRNA synthetase
MLLRGISLSGSQALLRQPARCLTPFKSVCKQFSIRTKSTASAEAVVEASQAVALPFKAQLDFKYIKENLAAISKNCEIRNSSARPAVVAELYDQFVLLKKECDGVRASRNENSQAMKV